MFVLPARKNSVHGMQFKWIKPCPAVRLTSHLSIGYCHCSLWSDFLHRYKQTNKQTSPSILHALHSPSSLSYQNVYMNASSTVNITHHAVLPTIIPSISAFLPSFLPSFLTSFNSSDTFLSVRSFYDVCSTFELQSSIFNLFFFIREWDGSGEAGCI